ncbi:MAG TPA: outer membrane protein assembly factor BamA [Rhodanobacteraceae bacterium]|nr:outer membrane protein assembly factor BamA [Rhodanobacteraceae bacterium]
MKRVAALILFAALSVPLAAYAFQPFTVSDIRIEGLQRIAAGTVLSYLPIEPGQTMTDATAQKAIQALFKTGFFSDVELEQQGSILVVKVQERPSIASLTVHGNKDIKTDQLLKGLKSAGMAEGQTFDRLTLDQIQQQLVSQYNDRGKYNVTVEPHVTNLDRNRVAIDIEIHEGKAAKIQEINIVGNHTYTDDEILKDWESGTPNWTSWYSNNDQYSREKLSGDLTKLSSYYLDRGYADFNINSAQVTISPNKQNIYIAAAIHEGDIFKISDIHLLGTLVLPEESLRRVLRIKPGEVFDRHSIELSADAITDVLSNIGYAFAKVSPIPKVDEQNHTVDLTFFVEPGPRVYVRRINFKGNTNTQDQVLRREMRQYEGAWYSQAAIDRSKVRLQRLGFFKDVNIDTVKVPGTTDEVDLNVKVTEESSGQFQFGVGYSQVSGIILSTSIANNNFLGTGNSVSATFSKSLFLKQYQVSFFDPYLTDSGIGIGYNASVLKLNQGEQNIASYLSDTDALSSYLSFPISETDSINVGLGFNKTRLDLIPGYTPDVFFDQMAKIGHYTVRSTPLTLSYAHDTLNSFYKPTRGGLQQVSAEIGLPGGTVPYYKLTLTSSDYFPLPFGFVGHLKGTLGYGSTYGSNDISVQYADANGVIRTMSFPFYQNYYAGGVQDVRGFQDNTLGPRICSGLIGANGLPDPTAIATADNTCLGGASYRPQPVGGAFKVLGTAELVLPFFKDNNKARLSLFTDVGNVYSSYSDFNASQLRASVGISLQWIAPVGPIVIDLARPIRDQPGDAPFEETLQFYFGRTF